MIKKVIQAIIKVICYVLAKIIYRVEAEGWENVPKDEGVLICGNHVHALDAPAFMATYGRKNVCFMAKQELFKNKFLKFLAETYGAFPVDRDKKDTEAIRKSLAVLKEKKILAIYPEGTRNGMAKGEPIKNGAVNIAIRTGSKIVPFAVIGSFKPFTKVKYRFGEPIDFSRYKENAKDKEVIDILTKELMVKVVELRDRDNSDNSKN